MKKKPKICPSVLIKLTAVNIKFAKNINDNVMRDILYNTDYKVESSVDLGILTKLTADLFHNDRK